MMTVTSGTAAVITSLKHSKQRSAAHTEWPVFFRCTLVVLGGDQSAIQRIVKQTLIRVRIKTPVYGLFTALNL